MNHLISIDKGTVESSDNLYERCSQNAWMGVAAEDGIYDNTAMGGEAEAGAGVSRGVSEDHGKDPGHAGGGGEVQSLLRRVGATSSSRGYSGRIDDGPYIYRDNQAG